MNMYQPRRVVKQNREQHTIKDCVLFHRPLHAYQSSRIALSASAAVPHPGIPEVQSPRIRTLAASYCGVVHMIPHR